jgi:hypothetical protein
MGHRWLTVCAVALCRVPGVWILGATIAVVVKVGGVRCCRCFHGSLCNISVELFCSTTTDNGCDYGNEDGNSEETGNGEYTSYFAFV